MESPKIKVKCNVDNCHYNSNEQCHAKALEVNTVGDFQAVSSSQTSCTTFKPDESNYR